MELFDILLWFVKWAIVVAAGGFVLTYCLVCYAKNNPKFDEKIRRDEYIRKRIDQAGGSFGSRHHARLWRDYGAEYDAILQAGRQPIP